MGRRVLSNVHTDVDAIEIRDRRQNAKPLVSELPRRSLKPRCNAHRGGRLARRGCRVPDLQARTGEFITTPGVSFHEILARHRVHRASLHDRSMLPFPAARLSGFSNSSIAMLYVLAPAMRPNFCGVELKRGPNPLRTLGALQWLVRASTPAVEHRFSPAIDRPERMRRQVCSTRCTS